MPGVETRIRTKFIMSTQLPNSIDRIPCEQLYTARNECEVNVALVGVLARAGVAGSLGAWFVRCPDGKTCREHNMNMNSPGRRPPGEW